MDSVMRLLESLGMPQYAAAMERAGYDDVSLLRTLSPGELDEMAQEVGMLSGHRLKMKKALASANHALPPSPGLQKAIAHAGTALEWSPQALEVLAALQAYNMALLEALKAANVPLPVLRAPTTAGGRAGRGGRGGRSGRGGRGGAPGPSAAHAVTDLPADLTKAAALTSSPASIGAVEGAIAEPSLSEARKKAAVLTKVEQRLASKREEEKAARVAAEKQCAEERLAVREAAEEERRQLGRWEDTMAAIRAIEGVRGHCALPDKPCRCACLIRMPTAAPMHRPLEHCPLARHLSVTPRASLPPSLACRTVLAVGGDNPADVLAAAGDLPPSKDMPHAQYSRLVALLTPPHMPPIGQRAAIALTTVENAYSIVRDPEARQKLAGKRTPLKEAGKSLAAAEIAPLTSRNLRRHDPSKSSSTARDDDATSERSHLSAGAVSMATSASIAASAITLQSNDHSRMRMGQREVDKRELQVAIKLLGKGATEESTFGPHKELRKKIKYNDLVFITDETRKILITVLPRRWYEAFSPPEQRKVELQWWFYPEAREASSKRNVSLTDSEPPPWAEQEGAPKLQYVYGHRLSDGSWMELWNDGAGRLMNADEQAAVISEREATIAAEREATVAAEREGVQSAAVAASTPPSATSSTPGSAIRSHAPPAAMALPAPTPTNPDIDGAASMAPTNPDIDARVREQVRLQLAAKREARKQQAGIIGGSHHQQNLTSVLPTNAGVPRQRPKLAATIVLPDTDLPLSAAATWADELSTTAELQDGQLLRTGVMSQSLDYRALLELLQSSETFPRETEQSPEKRMKKLDALVKRVAQSNEGSGLAELSMHIAIELQVRSCRLAFPVVTDLLARHGCADVNEVMQQLLHCRLHDAPERMYVERWLEPTETNPWLSAYALYDGRVPFRAIEQLVEQCCDEKRIQPPGGVQRTPIQALREVLSYQLQQAGCLLDADIAAGLRTCLSLGGGLDALVELLRVPVRSHPSHPPPLIELVL